MATEKQVPDWQLERLLAGDMPPDEASRVHERLSAEPGGQARLQALRDDNSRILDALPPEEVAREVHRRHKQARGEAALARPRRGGWALAVPAALGLGAALLVGLPRGAEPERQDPAGDTTRIKGMEPHLMIYRQVGPRAEKLEADASVSPGDRLQVSYNASGEPFGVIFSVDGAGAVTLHQPQQPNKAPALTTTGVVALPRSYTLDDAPDFERFFMVTAVAPFDVGAVVGAAKDLAQHPDAAASGDLKLPEGLHQTSILLRKVTP